MPRNAYGNVELFKESMLPAGTVYLKGTVYMYQGHSKKWDISQEIEMIQNICIFWEIDSYEALWNHHFS